MHHAYLNMYMHLCTSSCCYLIFWWSTYCMYYKLNKWMYFLLNKLNRNEKFSVLVQVIWFKLLKKLYLFFRFVFSFVLDAWGLLGLLKLASPHEICYKKYGCFSSGKPFTNTKGILPEKPQSMGVRFLLYTRKNPRKARKLKRCGEREEFLDENFPKPTKIIIHGYVDKGRKDWVKRMTREIIKNVSSRNTSCI